MDPKQDQFDENMFDDFIEEDVQKEKKTKDDEVQKKKEIQEQKTKNQKSPQKSNNEFHNEKKTKKPQESPKKQKQETETLPSQKTKKVRKNRTNSPENNNEKEKVLKMEYKGTPSYFKLNSNHVNKNSSIPLSGILICVVDKKSLEEEQENKKQNKDKSKPIYLVNINSFLLDIFCKTIEEKFNLEFSPEHKTKYSKTISRSSTTSYIHDKVITISEKTVSGSKGKKKNFSFYQIDDSIKVLNQFCSSLTKERNYKGFFNGSFNQDDVNKLSKYIQHYIKVIEFLKEEEFTEKLSALKKGKKQSVVENVDRNSEWFSKMFQEHTSRNYDYDDSTDSSSDEVTIKKPIKRRSQEDEEPKKFLKKESNIFDEHQRILFTRITKGDSDASEKAEKKKKVREFWEKVDEKYIDEFSKNHAFNTTNVVALVNISKYHLLTQENQNIKEDVEKMWKLK